MESALLRVIEETIAKLDGRRCSIEDDLGIVFSDGNWRNIENLVVAYLRGRLTWLCAPLSAEERDALIAISEAAIRLTKAMRSSPADLCARLQIVYDPDNNLNALARLNEPKSMPSSDDILDWGRACITLLKSVPQRKKGRKRRTEEINQFFALLKVCFESAILQVEGTKQPSFNKFAHEIFDLLPTQYPHRPQSFEAALKSFRRSGLGQE